MPHHVLYHDQRRFATPLIASVSLILLPPISYKFPIHAIIHTPIAAPINEPIAAPKYPNIPPIAPNIIAPAKQPTILPVITPLKEEAECSVDLIYPTTAPIIKPTKAPTNIPDIHSGKLTNMANTFSNPNAK